MEDLKCKICGKECTKREALRRHIIRHLKDKYQCSQCDKSYANNCNLKQHIKAVHEGQVLICEFESCTKMFESKSGYESHLKAHKAQFKYTCKICEKGMMNVVHFEAHMNRHYKIKPYECGLCYRTFYHTSDFNRHVKACGNIKSEQCKECGKTFTCEKYLKEHIKYKHLRKEPFLCNQCGKEFNYRGSLLSHMKIHHNESYENLS